MIFKRKERRKTTTKKKKKEKKKTLLRKTNILNLSVPSIFLCKSCNF